MRFDGKVAIITGAARGIGLGIAKRLASEGARTILWDRDCSTFDAGKARFTPHALDNVDVTSPEQVEAAVARVVADLGRIDILVNNAGINGPVVDVEHYDYAAWKQVLTVNLDGVFLCCRAVVPHMRQAGYGRIVNVASIAGKEGVPGIAAYSASKHAVVGFSKSLSRELLETGILVNCVAPVMAETELMQQMTAEHIAASKAKIPMKRFLQVPEIAATVAFAASDDCSFTTGFTFDLSGGRADY